MISMNLTYLRKDKKVSLEELAEAIGVSRQAVSKWESGETMPDLQNTIALAEFYGISVDDLISHKTENSNGKYVFGMVTIGERGQIVIPKKAREVFGFNPGDSLIVLGDVNQGGIALAKMGADALDFFMDGDKNFPTICGTGAEDYFCGSYNFDRGGQYKEFCTPYAGLHQVIRPDGTYQSQQRFGLYRWHITDPIRFEKDLRVTIQDLGWRKGGRYLPQKSDISSVAFWYQTEPHNKFPAIAPWEELEVN